ncbi:hypothetical protein C8A01DRAFT_34464 [Parachaetomium inaequale]|uniref:Uncharacterized protein n=1 Tax=Parachaetomium inaequale TaxID=2588326 RepID=A0AAN6ST21_9PEZI|nr:hypothetical protein C8A01DRAFT_34464 [Parachaetomium inaequale]
MVRLHLAILPALLGATQVLATASTSQPVDSNIILPPTYTGGPWCTLSTTGAAAAETASFYDNPFPATLKQCRRPPLKCDCGLNSTEMAELDAERAKHGCHKCDCDRPENAAGRVAAEGGLVAAGVAAIVGVVGVMVLL